jgi:hypothetical protein
VNSKDSSASSSFCCPESFDRRNPIDISLEATSGAILVFARVADTTHGHTILLSLVG